MKNTLFILVSLFLSLNTFGQLDFETHVTVNDTGGTNNPKSVFAADLDSDGYLDILSASAHDDKIAWYRNLDGQNNFAAQQIISETVLGASSVFAADLDADGDIDVLVASASGNSIGWFENLNGQGNFGAYQTISNLTEGASSVYALDADGDGALDVFSTSKSDNKIAWYKNLDGQGTFGPQQIISTNFDEPIYIDFGDIDGDGYLDFISGSSIYNGNIVWFKNINGQGNFVQQQILIDAPSTYNSSVLADIDGDGDLDIAAVFTRYSGESVVAWFKNTNGLGNFNSSPIQIATSGRSLAIFAEDFDNDGDPDIVIGDSNGIVLRKNNGNGTFGNYQLIGEPVEDVNALFAADLNNNGGSDLLISSGKADRVAWHKNMNGQGNFDSGTELAPINSANGVNQVISVDLDADGDTDIISALKGDNRLVWQENLNGQGSFSELKTIAHLKNVNCVYIDDIDGDGYLDVLAAGQSKLTWYKNLDGLGNFGPENIIREESFCQTIHTINLDNDGDLDIISIRFSEIYWQKNLDGLGNFGPPQLVSNNIGDVIFLVPIDIDNDGDEDIVASIDETFHQGPIVWFEKLNGQYAFSPPKIIDVNRKPGIVRVADLDNDGDIDIVTTDNSAILWYENTDGQGTYSNARIISENMVGVHDIYTKDLDGDGNIDIMSSSNNGSNNISWFKNVGSGNFNYQQIISADLPNPISIFADDYNGDGKMDVLTCSNSKDEIIWFENKGPLGINKNEFINTVLYPNPTDGLVYISSDKSIISVTVYNQLGHLILKEDNNRDVGLINLGKLAKGLYFVKLMDASSKSELKKIIIK